MQKIKKALASFAADCNEVRHAYDMYAAYCDLPWWKKLFVTKPTAYRRGYIYKNVRLYESGFTCIELRLSAFPSYKKNWKENVELAVRDHNCGYMIDCITLEKRGFLGAISMQISDLLEDRLDEYIDKVQFCLNNK